MRKYILGVIVMALISVCILFGSAQCINLSEAKAMCLGAVFKPVSIVTTEYRASTPFPFSFRYPRSIASHPPYQPSGLPEDGSCVKFMVGDENVSTAVAFFDLAAEQNHADTDKESIGYCGYYASVADIVRTWEGTIAGMPAVFVELHNRFREGGIDTWVRFKHAGYRLTFLVSPFFTGASQKNISIQEQVDQILPLFQSTFRLEE